MNHRVTSSIDKLREMGILEAVKADAVEMHVTLADLLGVDRHAHIAVARHECMRRLRARYGFSYPTIGMLFNRDHTTVMAAVRVACERLGLPPPKGRPLKAPAVLPAIPDLEVA